MQDINYDLISAVREGRLESARKLINSYGLSYSPGWEEGYVLLRDAVENQHAAIAKLLLTGGCKVNSKSIEPSDTPLHFAAISGDLEIVELILDKGGNVNAKNRNGRTPLHNAIKNKKEEITELLLRYGADINDIDRYDKSALRVAVQRGCLQIVEHLLNYGANVNGVSTSKWRKSYAPLHFAVEKGSHEIVTLLLSRGANVDVKEKDSITPLHIAAKEGYVNIAENLLNHGACIHSSTLKKGYTPIHIATQNGHERVVNFLLQHGAKVDDQDKDAKTILHLAVEKENLMIVKDVLKYCPDINNEGNRRVLKTAVSGCGEEYKNIVETLLEYGFTFNPEDAKDPTLLHAAVEKGYLKIVEDLLKHVSDVNTLLNISSEEGVTLLHTGTPLHTAVKNKQEAVAELLIRYGADVNAQDKTQNTPIFYAIENADLKIAKLLLSNGANVKDNPELLFISVKNGCLKINEVLLQHGADVNDRDKYGRTALHFTSSRNSGGFPRSLKPDVIKGEIAKLLLSKGAHVNAQTKDGTTALHIAIENGYIDVVKLLLVYGAEVDSKINSDFTPLHRAVQKRYKDIIETLLERGADINSRDKNGSTALHIACKEQYVEVVETLLEYGADIDIVDANNDTPLDFVLSKILVGMNYIYDYADLRPHQRIALRPYQRITRILLLHVYKMTMANLYLSAEIIRSVKYTDLPVNCDSPEKCMEEVVCMKAEKIKNTNISFYDILAKHASSLAIYMRNKNIVEALKSDDYETKFPIYVSMIKGNFRKAMKRKELLDQGIDICYSVFLNLPELPHHCTEEIFSYLSDEDLKNFNGCL